jgi:2,3-bisphosphoglycerate-dependent phosphoglycerate mutase
MATLPPDETRLVLVRHGESIAQVEGFLSGHDTCRGLSARGRAQAEALRARLATTGELGKVDAVYTSILPRTIETAEIIGPALGGITPVDECDWCEIHAGEAEGLTWDEFKARFLLEHELPDPFSRRIPGAESWAEFAVRAGTRLRRVAEEHPGEHVVVVCHGGIIGASFVALGDLPFGSVRALTNETKNTSLTEWQRRDGEWTLVRYNDAAHLAGVDR